MKAIKVFLMMTSLLVGALCLVMCSDSGTDSDNQNDFEVREWGVLVGCATDSSCFLTSRPEVSQLVKLPVIYVHSRSKTPFTIKATFPTGGPSDTYPPADMSKGSVEWRDVTFFNNSEVNKTLSGKDYEPLEHIIPALNNVDADLLEYNGWFSRFLFYEGSVQFQNRIAASYDLDSLTAHVTNLSNYTVYNINLVVRWPNMYGPLPRAYFAHWYQLDPGETKDALLGEGPVLSYVADMKAQGFTQMEAESFAGLWEQTFYLANSTSAISNLIYRLPRTLYILTHLQDSAPDTTVVRKMIGSWEWIQSSGGIAGLTITPETEGYTKTAHFQSDWTYKEERNDTTFLETTYRVDQDSVGNTIVHTLQVDGWEPMAIINVTDSTLNLIDQCIDCYQHSYRRLYIR
jgi:hypothetical protein